MSKGTLLAQRARPVVRPEDLVRVTAGQIQDAAPVEKAGERQKMNLRLPPRIFALLDTVSARRAGRPSRNALIGEAVEDLLRRERLL